MKVLNPIVLAAVVGLAGVSFASLTYADTSNETTGQYVKGSGITTKVKAAFLAQPGLDSTDIKVKTMHKGVVVLSGTVDTQAKKELAEKTAADVSGVNRVVNNLKVAE